MGRRKRGRDVDGVVLLDKPPGLSSNAALQRVRRAFDARKAGHTGSLDPLASGLLPICLGEATKLSSYLLTAEKAYRVTAVAGCETATGDREGEVTGRSDVPVPPPDALDALLADFMGRQTQIPPMYSALKQDGKRLYEHARAGRTVERAPREIIVSQLIRIASDTDGFTLDAVVSSGTYIRTLVEDIAKAYGGYAHVGVLRRKRVGVLGDAQRMVVLADIEAVAGDDAALARFRLPVSTVLADWPCVHLDAVAADKICHGGTLDVDHNQKTGGGVRLMGADDRMLGLGMIDDNGRLAPKRLFVRPQE